MSQLSGRKLSRLNGPLPLFLVRVASESLHYVLFLFYFRSQLDSICFPFSTLLFTET